MRPRGFGRSLRRHRRSSGHRHCGRRRAGAALPVNCRCSGWPPQARPPPRTPQARSPCPRSPCPLGPRRPSPQPCHPRLCGRAAVRAALSRYNCSLPPQRQPRPRPPTRRRPPLPPSVRCSSAASLPRARPLPHPRPHRRHHHASLRSRPPRPAAGPRRRRAPRPGRPPHRRARSSSARRPPRTPPPLPPSTPPSRRTWTSWPRNWSVRCPGCSAPNYGWTGSGSAGSAIPAADPGPPRLVPHTATSPGAQQQ